MKIEINITEKEEEFVLSLSFNARHSTTYVHALKRPIKYEDLKFTLETIIDSVRDATEREIEHTLHQTIKRRECRDCGEFKHRSEGRYIGEEFLCNTCDKFYKDHFGDA